MIPSVLARADTCFVGSSGSSHGATSTSCARQSTTQATPRANQRARLARLRPTWEELAKFHVHEWRLRAVRTSHASITKTGIPRRKRLCSHTTSLALACPRLAETPDWPQPTSPRFSHARMEAAPASASSKSQARRHNNSASCLCRLVLVFHNRQQCVTARSSALRSLQLQHPSAALRLPELPTAQCLARC